MKKVISLILFSISATCFASTAQVNNVDTFGGTDGSTCMTVPKGNPDGIFTLESPGTSGTDIYHFYKNGVAYQVTAGKKFVMSCLCFDSASQDYGQFMLFSGTNNYADGAGIGTVTGPVYEGGSTTGFLHLSLSTFASRCQRYTYEFSASTYPGVFVRNNNNHVMIMGKEI